MKRIILIVILIVGLTAANSFAQMGQGHMEGQGMMGQSMMGQSMMDQGYMGNQPRQSGERPYGGAQYDSGLHPCQEMMRPGMMGHMGGYGMGRGMMGHMGGYGMGRGMMGQMDGCGMGRGMMGHMGGYGMGQGMMGQGGYGSSGYSPEVYQQYQEEYQKFLDDTADLRKELHSKKFDYFEARRNPDTKRGDLLKLEKAVRDIQWEIYEKSPR